MYEYICSYVRLNVFKVFYLVLVELIYMVRLMVLMNVGILMKLSFL